MYEWDVLCTIAWSYSSKLFEKGTIMRRKEWSKGTAIVVLSSLILQLLFLPIAAQEVQLKIGDTLELTVPQRQELDHRMVIDDNGDVELPIVGKIHLEGMTLSEAEETVLRQMREVYPSVRQARLSLIGEEARRMAYVQGQVVNPGKYEFRESPTIWEAIREAGGVTAEASLETVRLIRAGEGEERTEIVNVQVAIDTGDLSSLPVLRPGDTVIVPERSTSYLGSGAVNVMGGVLNPAPYVLSGDKRLVDAIIAAGGAVENADLSKIAIIRTRPEGGSITIEVDFRKYLKEGDMRHNPPIYPNDTISVPQHRAFRTILTSPGFLLGLITVTATTITLFLTRSN
jgi:polysaccharide export outer membrane protein